MKVLGKEWKAAMRLALLAASAMASAIALPVLARGQDRVVAPKEFQAEECYGITKARQNDCQTLTHSCASMSSVDKDPESWIYLPAGTCVKIVGGRKTPKV